MSKKSPSNGWDRQELNLRLTRRRRDQLTELAAKLAPDATPTDAIDYSLRISTNDDKALDSRIEDLEEIIERHASERRLQIERLENGLHALARGLDALRALISDVAASGDF